MKRIYAGIGVIALVLSLGACGLGQQYNDDRGKGDAPVGETDDSEADVVNMPNEFSNVAHKCDGAGHRIFVTTQTNGYKSMVVINDESCR